MTAFTLPPSLDKHVEAAAKAKFLNAGHTDWEALPRHLKNIWVRGAKVNITAFIQSMLDDGTAQYIAAIPPLGPNLGSSSRLIINLGDENDHH